jgi:hypothetical protein
LVGESDKRTDKAIADDTDTSVNSSASSDKNVSLSFGSDTDFLLGETYAIIDPEVKSDGLLSFGSPLPPGIIQAVKPWMKMVSKKMSSVPFSPSISNPKGKRLRT